MQVDEALKVRFEDVEIQEANPSEDLEECLFVTVKGGKLSYLKKPTEMIGLPGAVKAFERLKLITPNFQPNNLLFPVNPRETIQALLQGAGLLLDTSGQRRTAKCFRHTYIMLR